MVLIQVRLESCTLIEHYIFTHGNHMPWPLCHNPHVSASSTSVLKLIDLDTHQQTVCKGACEVSMISYCSSGALSPTSPRGQKLLCCLHSHTTLTQPSLTCPHAHTHKPPHTQRHTHTGPTLEKTSQMSDDSHDMNNDLDITLSQWRWHSR